MIAYFRIDTIHSMRACAELVWVCLCFSVFVIQSHLPVYSHHCLCHNYCSCVRMHIHAQLRPESYMRPCKLQSNGVMALRCMCGVCVCARDASGCVNVCTLKSAFKCGLGRCVRMRLLCYKSIFYSYDQRQQQPQQHRYFSRSSAATFFHAFFLLSISYVCTVFI